MKITLSQEEANELAYERLIGKLGRKHNIHVHVPDVVQPTTIAAVVQTRSQIYDYDWIAIIKDARYNSKIAAIKALRAHFQDKFNIELGLGAAKAMVELNPRVDIVDAAKLAD